MLERQESSLNLIHLSGVDFRKTAVQCPYCNWSGLAGELKMARNSGRDNSVRYACPACELVIATHIGLSDQEVLQEMERIRLDLAKELAAHPVGEAHTARLAKPKIDFKSVRSQITFDEMTVEGANEKVAIEARVAAAESKAPGNEAASGSVSSRKAPDFEAVRARMLIG